MNDLDSLEPLPELFRQWPYFLGRRLFTFVQEQNRRFWARFVSLGCTDEYVHLIFDESFDSCSRTPIHVGRFNNVHIVVYVAWCDWDFEEKVFRLAQSVCGAEFELELFLEGIDRDWPNGSLEIFRDLHRRVDAVLCGHGIKTKWFSLAAVAEEKEATRCDRCGCKYSKDLPQREFIGIKVFHECDPKPGYPPVVISSLSNEPEELVEWNKSLRNHFRPAKEALSSARKQLRNLSIPPDRSHSQGLELKRPESSRG